MPGLFGDLFDFDGNGNTSFEEQMLGTMLVMGAFDEPATDEADADELYDDPGEDDCDDF